MFDRETPWTTRLSGLSENDHYIHELPIAGFLGSGSNLEGYVLHKEMNKTAMPTDLIDDGIRDQSRNYNLGNIHNHGITTARETLARTTYSCHRVNDNIDGLNGLDEKEAGDEFEGGWMTYVLPFIIAGGATYLLYRTLNEDD